MRDRLAESEGFTIPGPYRASDLPDALFLGNHPGDLHARPEDEEAYSPAITDALNRAHLLLTRQRGNPLGDIVPFSAYLIGRILSPDGYPVDFNLDADRGYGYLCWDWTRNPVYTAKNYRGQPYVQPVVPPEGATKDGGANPWAGVWRGANNQWKQAPVQLHYIDRTPPRVAVRQDTHHQIHGDHP